MYRRQVECTEQEQNIQNRGRMYRTEAECTEQRQNVQNRDRIYRKEAEYTEQRQVSALNVPLSGRTSIVVVRV